MSLQEKKEQFDGMVPLDVDLSKCQRPDNISVDFIDKDWLGVRAVVVHNVLSESERRAIMDFFDAQGITQPCHSKLEYRNNLRMVAGSESIAQLIFSRVAPFLDNDSLEMHESRQTVTPDNASNFTNQGLGMRGEWQMTGLNPCFRICKYNPDGHFGPHYDADYVKSYHARSFKTFMIYLNDDYEAGQTNFVTEHDMSYNEETKRFCSPKEAVRASLKAKAGDALIFDHHILHEGATVKSGVKYIMRSELMYERKPSDSPEEKREADAYTNYFEACRLEAEGRAIEAITFYKRAFKLLPELQNFS